MRSFPGWRSTWQTAALVTILTTAANGQIFVDADPTVPGPRDGSSWSQAYATIGAALAVAVATDDIWIANGTYPETLDFLTSGIDLFGGFEGFDGAQETLLSQRNPRINRAILDASGIAAPNHVIDVSGVGDIVIDGLSIKGGDTTGAILVERPGAGIYITGALAEITVQNCIIYENHAIAGGGGIYAIGGVGDINIRDNILFGNSSLGDGGGLRIDGVGASLDIDRNYVLGNTSADDGAGISLTGLLTGGNIRNCLVAGNRAGSTGGGIELDGSAPDVYNCTLADNVAVGANPCSLVIRGLLTAPNMRNTIFARGSGTAIIHTTLTSVLSGGFDIDDCLFFGNPGGFYSEPFILIPYTYTTLGGLNGDIRFDFNLSGDPLFRGDLDPTGTWTSAPVYNPLTDTTTFTDATLSLSLHQYRWNRFLQANMAAGPTAARSWSAVVGNTATTIEVIGDLTGLVSNGDTYRIRSYPIRSAASPAIDNGQALLPNDIALAGRPVVIVGPASHDIGCYELQNDPLLVDLEFFTAETNGSTGTVTLRWETSEEVSNAGFHLYRTIGDGPEERITDLLIPGLGDSLVGASYAFEDPSPMTPGEVRYYWLEDVELDGDASRNGPAIVGWNGSLDASVSNWAAFE